MKFSLEGECSHGPIQAAVLLWFIVLTVLKLSSTWDVLFNLIMSENVI